MKEIIMALVLGAAGVVPVTAGELFHDGQTEWQIGLSPKANAVEQYAAEELQGALKKISGADFEIVKAEELPERNVIFIGTPKSSPRIAANAGKLQLTKDKTEEVAVFTLDDNLFLAGNNPRGSLYAVYSFLRNQLGVRWFWPGDDGEFMPKMTKYTLPDLQYRYRPAFRFREMTPCCWHYHVPTEVWLARNFCNGGSRTVSIRDKAGFYRSGGEGHSVSINGKFFGEFPEYFSLVDGKRVKEGEAGCWSNPGFTKRVVDWHLDWIKKRNVEFLKMFPADTTVRCQCAECTKNPDPSSRWFDYYYTLIQEIRKTHPEMLFTGIAYQEYRDIPKKPVQGLEYVEYCQYNRCYVHKLNDPDCPVNQKSMAELTRWQEKAPMGVYGYEFDIYNAPIYLPFWNMLADAMKTFRDIKLVRIKTELIVRYPKNAKRVDLDPQTHRIANYLFTQLMWNPDADVNVLLKDFCDYVYGPGAAGDAMYAYHRGMASAWDAMKQHIGYFGNAPDGTAEALLNDERIKFSKEKFEEAEKAVRSEPPSPGQARRLGEIALEKELFERWVKYYEIAKKNAVTLKLPVSPDDRGFEGLAELPVTSRKGKHLPTEIRMYRSAEALHIQAVCHEPDMANLRKGLTGKDVRFWESDNIEFFIDLKDGSPYRQFGVNAAGGTYDAIAHDTGWNPEWKASVRLEKDRWITEIALPFRSLGKETPRDGEFWKIVVIRNSKPEACAFPAPVYRDLSLGATVFFSDSTAAYSTLTWISCPHGQGREFANSRSALLKRGWLARGFLGPEEAATADLSRTNLILIETYQNKLPQNFYHDKLLPAVRDGAVAVFVCYYWIDDLHKQLQDPSFETAFKDDVATIRRPSWFTDNSFATTPNKINPDNWITPAGVFTPKYPEKWDILAKQHTKSTGSEKPFIMARPLGKGMIVLTGSLYWNQAVFLENILAYNNAVRRE